MTTQLLSRSRRRTVLPFLGGLALARGRTHEFCGPARVTLALMAAQATEGPVIWIAPGWRSEVLFPAGVLRFIEPQRLIFARAERTEDMLWSAEEALRAGVAGMVVADLEAPPALTPVRRLHLAAETGAALARDRGVAPPLGLLLCPGDGGAQGVESRWHLAPRHSAAQEEWRLERRRARAEPPAAWRLTLPQDKPRLCPAPPPG